VDQARYKWYVVGLLWCVCFLNYADREAIFSLFPLLEKELRLTPVQLGLLGSAFAWVYGLGAPFAGSIVDRVRRKTAVLSGLYTWSVIAAATALSRSFRQLFSFMAAEGLGETFYVPASMSMISDYHGRATRSRAMGMHQTSVYVGTIGGGFFAGLIGERYGWRWSFVFFGGLGILLGLVLVKLLCEPQRGAADREDSEAGLHSTFSPQQAIRAAHPQGPGPGFSLNRPSSIQNRAIERAPLGESLSMILGTPSALLLMGAFMCANFVALVLLSWMPKFLYDKFHLSLAMAGLSATIFVQLASMAGSLVGGWFADLFRRRITSGRVLVQAAAVLCGAPFVFLCGRTTSVLWVMVWLTVWGLFKGLYDANIFASLFDVVTPQVRGTAAGLMNMVGWLGGGGLAPVLIGYIAQRAGLGFAISCSAVVYVTAGLLLLTVLAKEALWRVF
jgi:MFS family permease